MASTDDDPPAIKDTTEKKRAKKGSGFNSAGTTAHHAKDPLDKRPPAAPKPDGKDSTNSIANTWSAGVSAQVVPSTVQSAGPIKPGPEALAPTTTKQTATTTEFAFAAADPAATPIKPTLLNVVGSFFFHIFEAVNSLAAGPPVVPPNSGVRESTAPLRIDCGPGVTAEADWYFPTNDPTPTRLIYLQHGFPATASDYDYTAAELAEYNDAIVVAPTITSNFFDCYGCQLVGNPMHAAVAKLFEGDRSALTESARLASGDETLVLPTRFVLAGHSAGGLLAAGAAGYYSADVAAAGAPNDLAGVLLLDTSSVGGMVQDAMTKIPGSVPVYTISATPGPLDDYGGANDVLEAARPGQFVGVQLVGGVHSDAAQSGNPIAQFLSQVAGLGFSRPENVDAVQVLAQGWISDWYGGTHTGIYGTLGSTIDIPTSAGIAQADVLPTTEPKLTFIDRILEALVDSAGNLNFAYCATSPTASADTPTDPFATCSTGTTKDD